MQVKAVVMNHGSYTNREEVEAVRQPTLINASDNDQLLSRERLAQYTGVLDCKKDVPSEVKVSFCPDSFNSTAVISCPHLERAPKFGRASIAFYYLLTTAS